MTKNKHTRLLPGFIHIIIFLIPLAIIAFLIISGLPPFGKKGNVLGVGEKAPDFTLNDFEGNQVKLSNLKGQALVLEFWDSRCQTCLEELLILQKLQTTFPQVSFLGIHVNNSPIENQKRAKAILSDNLEISFPQLKDVDGKVYDMYKFNGTDPITYFVDKEGIVSERFSDFRTETEITAQIQKLIQ